MANSSEEASARVTAALGASRCQELVEEIEASVLRSELLPSYLPVCAPELLPTVTTLGLAYDNECVVTRVLIGGPAFLSRTLVEGDTLVAVNGVLLRGIHGALDDGAIIKLLIGDDVPGTECQVEYKSSASGRNESVILRRMDNNTLAHKVHSASENVVHSGSTLHARTHRITHTQAQ